MKIIVIGTRGIPNYLGGVETHCQELYPRLVKLGCDVTVIRRTAYRVVTDTSLEYKGVKLVDLFSPKKKGIEAIVHTVLAICYARIKSPDILHVQAIGPSLLIPFARLLGLKVVSTNHGPDYDRQKWGKAAKFILKLGEKFGAKFSNHVIVISTVIQDIIKNKYNRDSRIIFNGIAPKESVQPTDFLASLNLIENKYIVAVGRFVEEKGFHDLISAFSKLKKSDIKLVLVGDSDYENNYSNALKKQAREAGVTLTGFVSGNNLIEVFCNAKLFVMPSYHEGLSITLLEAMSFSLPILVSDIPANSAVKLPSEDYFSVGNVDELKVKLEEKLISAGNTDYSKYRELYDWDRIAQQTYNLYQEI